MILENDWECRMDVNFMPHIIDIFKDNDDVDIVQLRAVWDPNENWGKGKPEYSPWSSSELSLKHTGLEIHNKTTSKGHPYYTCRFPNGFNNNPCVMRKSLYRQCGPYPEAEVGCDPRHGETLYQNMVAETHCATAHIGLELYYHCGRTTTKII
jgi:hypothetical protein